MRRGRRWRLVVVTAVAGGIIGQAPAALAHPIGGRSDLPVPAGLFAVVTSLALVATFVLLTVSWQAPRLQEPRPERRTSNGFTAALGPLLGVTGMVCLVLTLLAGALDSGDPATRNVAPVLVFIAFWLVVPLVSALVGDWWRWLSPWRTLSERLNRRRAERVEWVERLGVWPAAGSLLAFAWMTHVSPASARAPALAVAAACYTAYIVVAGRIAGPATGLRLFDGFHTSNALMAAMAPVDIGGGDSRAGIAHRGWLRGLTQVPEWRGLPALVVVLIGGVTYDGLAGTEVWIEAAGDLRLETWFATLALLGVVAVLGGAYALTCRWGARLVGGGLRGSRVAARFVHILVPVALAYLAAHYFTLVLYEGQLILSAASDPFGRGWDLFGTAAWRTVAFLDPTVVWLVQVAVMAAGHAAALVLAHDRALADYGALGAARIQYAMLTLVVALASLGLFLLSG